MIPILVFLSFFLNASLDSASAFPVKQRTLNEQNQNRNIVHKRCLNKSIVVVVVRVNFEYQSVNF